MKLAITGADQPLGAALCQQLATEHSIIPVGSAEASGLEASAEGYRRADLSLPPSAATAIRGADMIVHTQPHDARSVDGPGAEGELLERISRGTYVLVQAAVAEHIGRIVLVSHMHLFDRYPADYVIGPDWQPRPKPNAESLAPYMAELVCREIARTGQIEAVNLRMAALGAPYGLSSEDAAAAVYKALHMDLSDSGYHWHQEHVVAGAAQTSGKGN